MTDEFAAYQQCIKDVANAVSALNDARVKLHAAIDAKAAEIGSQVASDTSVKLITGVPSK